MARISPLALGTTAALASCLVLTASAAPAAAQAPPVLAPDAPAPRSPSGSGFLSPQQLATFGSPGQLVLSADLQLSIARVSGDFPSATSVLIQPGLDYFIAPHLSVGGLLSHAHGPAASIGENTFGFQVRAGYDLTLNELFSWWVRAALGFFHGSQSNPGFPDSSASEFAFEIFAPVLWHVVPHFFVGFGPKITTDLSTSGGLGKQTFIGVQSTIGGYFNL